MMIDFSLQKLSIKLLNKLIVRRSDPSFHHVDAKTDTHLHTISFGMIDPTFPKGRHVD